MHFSAIETVQDCEKDMESQIKIRLRGRNQKWESDELSVHEMEIHKVLIPNVWKNWARFHEGAQLDIQVCQTWKENSFTHTPVYILAKYDDFF